MLTNVWAGLTSWAVAMLALFGDYRNEVMYVLGLILVLARLAQELPKAYKSIKEWWSNKNG